MWILQLKSQEKDGDSNSHTMSRDIGCELEVNMQVMLWYNEEKGHIRTKKKERLHIE